MAQHIDRHIPANNNAGWPIAAGVIALAAACAIGATVIHGKTYRQPTDVTWSTPNGTPKTDAGHAQPASAEHK
jgi:hypothetical protein